MTLTLSKEVYRRFLMGKQGLWPGRRWQGIDGITQAVRECQLIQMDPLVALHRAHDIALWGRVADYSPDLLMKAMYKDRALFDWGTTLHIYPMEELPYWRGGPMRWKAQYGRIDEIAQQHPDVIEQVRAALRERAPLGQRDFSGEASKIYTYRSGKVPGLALYYLWIAGEIMTHSRKNFDRLYAFTEDVAPEAHQWIAPPEQAWAYIYRKTIRTMGVIPEKQFHKTLDYWMQSRMGGIADQPLKELYESGDITKVQVGHLKGTFLVMTEDLPLIDDLMAGRIPQAWQPIGATTSDEVTFLAPLEMVSARGRAKEVFGGFDYIWEVYKPAHLRKWGYYVLPILYGDQLVARMDAKLDRKTMTLYVLGFWLEDHQPTDDPQFIAAMRRGLANFAAFHEAESVDVSAVGDWARFMEPDATSYDVRFRESMEMANKSYYKFNDNYGGSPIGDNVTYLEVEEKVVLKQISWNGTEYIASNVIYPPWGLVMSDQPLDEPFDDLIVITREEFEAVWQGHLAARQDVWRKVKQDHPIQTTVQGHILLFFPQGVIVNLGNNALGVADYHTCRASTTWENMYPKHKVTATVSGYDEENQWLILDAPQVHSDVINP